MCPRNPHFIQPEHQWFLLKCQFQVWSLGLHSIVCFSRPIFVGIVYQIWLKEGLITQFAYNNMVRVTTCEFQLPKSLCHNDWTATKINNWLYVFISEQQNNLCCFTYARASSHHIYWKQASTISQGTLEKMSVWICKTSEIHRARDQIIRVIPQTYSFSHICRIWLIDLEINNIVTSLVRL